MKKRFKIKSYKNNLRFIPYQCCPVCNGLGKILADGFTSSAYQQCPVCFGSRIIPMCVVPEITLANFTSNSSGKIIKTY